MQVRKHVLVSGRHYRKYKNPKELYWRIPLVFAQRASSRVDVNPSSRTCPSAVSIFLSPPGGGRSVGEFFAILWRPCDQISEPVPSTKGPSTHLSTSACSFTPSLTILSIVELNPSLIYCFGSNPVSSLTYASCQIVATVHYMTWATRWRDVVIKRCSVVSTW